MIKPEFVQDHLDEYREWVKTQDNDLKTPEDMQSLLEGFLSAYGIHARHLERIHIDLEERVIFFPFLDNYWTRAGRVFLSFEELEKTRLMTWRRRLSACLREAERVDEAHLLFHPHRGRELRERIRNLGGSE